MIIYYQGDDIVLPFILEDSVTGDALDTDGYVDLWLTIYRCSAGELVEAVKFSKIPNSPAYRDLTMKTPTSSGEFEAYIPRSLTKDFKPGGIYVAQLDRWETSGYAEGGKKRRIASDVELFKIVKSINPDAA